MTMPAICEGVSPFHRHMRLLYLLFPLLLLLGACQKRQTIVRIETEFGDIRVRLYDETPLHRDNFLKLAQSGFYDSLLFHRVIRDFVIQGGDPTSKYAAPGVLLGGGEIGYTIPAEIRFPHVRGALSAARKPDAVNPQRASDGSQFYIVQGQRHTDASLDELERAMGIKFSPDWRARYKAIGGTPQLDGQYTVFGEVISGMEVVDRIAAVPRDANDRPLEDIRMKVRVE